MSIKLYVVKFSASEDVCPEATSQGFDVYGKSVNRPWTRDSSGKFICVKISDTIVFPIPNDCCKQILLKPSKDGVLRRYFNALDLDKFNYQPTFRNYINEIGLHTMTYNATIEQYHIIHDVTKNVVVKIFAGKGICPEHATIFLVDAKPGEGHWTLDSKIKIRFVSRLLAAKQLF